MKSHKPISTLFAIIILIIGTFFEFWIASLFSLGGTFISILFFIPTTIAVLCLCLALYFVKIYSRKQGVGLLTIIGLIFFALAGLIINVAINIYGLSQFHINP